MNTRRLLWRFILTLALFASIGGMLSCGQEVQTGPRAWIDFPRDGSTVPVDTPVTIISHAYARDGVAEVLLSVDGEAYRRDPPAEPGATFSEVTQEWLPQEAGNYTLQVVTYDANGETSNPATVSIRVVGEVALVPTATPTEIMPPPPDVTVTPTDTPTPTPTGTQPPTGTPTPTPTITQEPPTPTFTPTAPPPPPPSDDIRLWADNENIEAGSCTTVRWHVSNVQAYWVNGQPGAGDDGSFQTCPCQDETHTLRAVRSDGSEKNLSVTIRVSGQCEEQPPPPPQDAPPPPDTQGPDISGLKSSEGSIDYSCDHCPLPCKTDISANVTDKSGVAWVKLIYKPPKQGERSGGMNKVGGSTYRATINANGWNAGTLEFWVRAQDNKGNISESGHSKIKVEDCVW